MSFSFKKLYVSSPTHIFQTVINNQFHSYGFPPTSKVCVLSSPFFTQVLKYILQMIMISFQKLAAFLALMMFTSQLEGVIAAPRPRPSLALRAPVPQPPFRLHEGDVGNWIIDSEMTHGSEVLHWYSHNLSKMCSIDVDISFILFRSEVRWILSVFRGADFADPKFD